MSLSHSRAWLLVAATLAATSACSANRTVPYGGIDAADSALRVPAVDTTSILKKLTKDVVIGSTVDPKNGDHAPHGLAIVPIANGLKKGQLLACNYASKSNAAGAGTTIEVLNSKAGSKPAPFATSSSILGCNALAITMGNAVWSAGTLAHAAAQFDPTTGKLAKSLGGADFPAPFGATYAQTSGLYPSEDVFVSDAKTGSILRIDVSNAPLYNVTVIAKGFAVNKKTGTALLGPSGLQYDKSSDTLYIIDGVNDTVVAFTSTRKLLLTNGIVVGPTGKTFTGANAKYAKLVYAGTALKSPVGSALLPNGNLIIANTAGNTLVEMTPAGQVLDTKVVDTSKTPGVFGLIATGTSDANAALYFADSNASNVQALEQ